jgi:hypothetical protein
MDRQTFIQVKLDASWQFTLIDTSTMNHLAQPAATFRTTLDMPFGPRGSRFREFDPFPDRIQVAFPSKTRKSSPK